MNITINDDLSSLVVSEDGLMECILPPYNPETQVPFTSEAEVNAFASTINTNPNYFSIKLSDEEKAVIVFDIESESVRQERDMLLTSIVDAINPMRYKALSEADQLSWDQYRLDLLAVPQQVGFPFDVVFPDKFWIVEETIV
jgi:hypothetical protein